MEFQKYLLNISKFDTNRLRSKETLVSSILTDSYSQVNKLRKKEAWFALFEQTFFLCRERKTNDRILLRIRTRNVNMDV